jgi:nucleoside-diphosphate-sugar epimerase
MKRIGLFGAAGAVGKSISTAFSSRQISYRVVGRDRESLTKTFGHDPLAEIVTWNPDNAESIRLAARGMDTLIYLVGVRYDQFHLHPILMRKTVEAAIAEGVERILLVGTVYPYGMPRTNPVKEDHPREPHTFKGKMRKEQEDVLLSADASGKIRGSVLRLPDFYGPQLERSLIYSLFEAAARGKTANLLGPIDTPHQFIFVPDVGPVVASLAERPEAYGRWWHLAGAEVTTQRDIAERVFKMAGRKPRFRIAGKNMLRVLGLFDPIMRELVEMNYLLTNPVVIDDSALQDLLGPIPKTPLNDGLRISLAASQDKVDRATS